MFNNTPAFSSYSIKDIKESLDFYKNVLEVDASETPEGISLELNGNSLFLYPKENHTPATFTVLNFKVDDIDEAVKQLGDKGIKLKVYENSGMEVDSRGVFRGKSSGMGPDIAWIEDPSGNIISVLEE